LSVLALDCSGQCIAFFRYTCVPTGGYTRHIDNLRYLSCFSSCWVGVRPVSMLYSAIR
jgi:hypothetical protein